MSDEWKITTKEPGEWTMQLSIKVEGQHLLNLRSEDAVGFSDMLKWATENREAILAACAALEGVRKPEPMPPPRPTGRPPIGPQRVSGGEIGPIVLEAVEVKNSGKDGKPFRNPMYSVRYEGSRATTFDQLIGKAAEGFWRAGAPCYVTVEPAKDPRFTNLTSIRSAVTS